MPVRSRPSRENILVYNLLLDYQMLQRLYKNERNVTRREKILTNLQYVESQLGFMMHKNTRSQPNQNYWKKKH